MDDSLSHINSFVHHKYIMSHFLHRCELSRFFSRTIHTFEVKPKPSGLSHITDIDFQPLFTMAWDWNMPRYRTPWYWKGAFCFTAHDLVNPQSELTQRYPHLHQVFRHRLESAYAARDNRSVSLCSHTNLLHGYRGCRSDTDGFQKKNQSFISIEWSERGRNATRNRMNNMCSEITDQMDVYGTAGQGSKLNPPEPLSLHVYVLC
jgi:hypothetical protein